MWISGGTCSRGTCGIPRCGRKHLPITLPTAPSRAANGEVVPLRSWVRRSACPGRRQRLRAVLAYLVDAQHRRPAGTGPPSRRTTDPSTGSRCGGVQKAFRTWSAGRAAPGGVSCPPNHVGDVVVTSRRARTRFVAKTVETALRKAAAPLALCRRGFASLSVSPRHGAALAPAKKPAAQEPFVRPPRADRTAGRCARRHASKAHASERRGCRDRGQCRSADPGTQDSNSSPEALSIRRSPISSSRCGSSMPVSTASRLAAVPAPNFRAA